MAEISADPENALDAEQARIVAAPASARLLVTAGPGTGKTRTLLARAGRLVEEEGLEPAEDLILLSFSRAAVETVAARGRAETGLGRLPVSTVDSLASRILFETGTPTAGRGFDERVSAAIEVLAEDPPGLDDFLGARQVLVDEAQDVVGVRADFVLALLEYVCRREGAGFTVFGDAAQAIFDFQGRGKGEMSRLLDLLGEAPLGVEKSELTRNYRMQNPRLVDLAARFGPPLRSGDGDGDWERLWGEIADEVRLEAGWLRPDEARAEVGGVAAGPGHPTVAVLTRTNVDALRLGARLQAGGLDVAFRHRAQDRGGAPWLAAAFGDEEFSDVPLSALVERPEPRPWLRPPEEPARPLREAGVARAGRVDLRRLASLLRAGACPESLVVQRRAAVTVSTIHQAKGLEFDTVYVTDYEPRHEAENAAEEARVLYVAATRARDELLCGAGLKKQGPFLKIDGGARVGVGSWRGRGGAAEYVEVKVCDSDPEWAPADRDAYDRVQELLLGRVEPGDRADLRLAGKGPEGEPLYAIVHHGPEGSEATVGQTGAGFGAMLRAWTRGRPPEQITGLVADVPDAAAFGSAVARRLGLGEHGLHLRMRVYGLAWVGK